MTGARPGSGLAAAGGVVWRPSRKHGVRVAVVHRPRYDDWSLPKGKAEPGETMPVTASREILEETGYLVALGRFVGQATYRVSAGQKKVDYFSAAVLGGEFTANKEVDTLEWLSVSAARKRLTYEFDQHILDRFGRLPVNLSTVVLVRHARAGHRESYDGADAARPLDGKGRRQALALSTDLLPFAPLAVYSAPLVRCRATVEPLADKLGLPVFDEPDLAEEVYRDDPGAARRKVMEYAGPIWAPDALPRTADPVGKTADVAEPPAVRRPQTVQGEAKPFGAVIAGSQGGVIPGVVKALAARGRISLPGGGTPKGSFWVLSFDGRRLVQADHYPPPPV